MDFRTEEPLASEPDRMGAAVRGRDEMGWDGGFVGVGWSTVWVALYGPIITTYGDGVAGAQINSSILSIALPRLFGCSCRRGGTADYRTGASRRKGSAALAWDFEAQVWSQATDAIFETPAGGMDQLNPKYRAPAQRSGEMGGRRPREGVTIVLMGTRRRLEARQWSRQAGLVARTFGVVGNQVDCMGKARRM